MSEGVGGAIGLTVKEVFLGAASTGEAAFEVGEVT